MDETLVQADDPAEPAEPDVSDSYRTNPGWSNWPIALTFAALVIIAGVFAEKEGFGLVLVIFGLIVIGFVALARSRTEYVVTGEDVVADRGVIRRRKDEVRISDIGAVSVEQSFVGRMLGVGDVRIQTPSLGGVTTLEQVPDPDRLVREIKSRQT